MTVHVTVANAPAMQEFLSGADGKVAHMLLAKALRVETVAKNRVKVDHGRLRSSITHALAIAETGGPAIRVGTNLSYARDVHEGTGVYGPHGHPIVPASSTVLRFTSRKTGRLTFARTVRGQEANPFLRDAIEQVV